MDVERKGPNAKSMHRIICSSVHDQLQFWTSDLSVVETTSRVRNSLFNFSPYIFNYQPLLPTSTSHPPDVIHVTGVSRTSLFFTCSSASVYYTLTEEQKRGRPGNEAISEHLTLKEIFPFNLHCRHKDGICGFVSIQCMHTVQFGRG